MADDTPLTVVKSEPLPTLTVTDDQPSAPPSAMQTFWTQHPNAAQLARGTLNTLPMVGGIAGAAVATPETLGAGTIVGGALGTGAGQGARDLLVEALGLDSPTTPLSKGSRIALATAISAALPAAVGTAKRVLTDPKGTLADLLETFSHPQKTTDAIVSYLRSSSTASVPPVSEGFTLPQAVPYKMADGTWGVKSAVGNELTPGQTVNVWTNSGKQFVTTVPKPIDPHADIRAAQMLTSSGLSPYQAAMKASEGNPARFSKIMSAFMQGGAK